MKKVVILVFGSAAYLLFLVAFLYAIGFITNWVVPKSVDNPDGNWSMNSIIVNVLLLGLFAVQHSVMARPWFKRWITKYIDKAVERSVFVMISSLLLLLLYWQWQPINVVVWQTNGTAAIILQAIGLLGWLIVLAATFMINHFDLFGLKQVFDNLKEKGRQETPFQISWFYRIVRHPLMLGFLIAFWSAPIMTAGHLLFTVCTTAYILIAVKCFEEKDLVREHGDAYRQ
ncbi:MAG TPA: NnrU family protein, partial [Flavisolibacter sp.]|nr:NnrU family protein [Flavisolibacter sp.]